MQGQRSLRVILILCLPWILGSNNNDHDSYCYMDTSFHLLDIHGFQANSTSVILLEPNNNAVRYEREENASLAQQGLKPRFLTPSPGLLAPMVPLPPC